MEIVAIWYSATILIDKTHPWSTILIGRIVGYHCWGSSQSKQSKQIRSLRPAIPNVFETNNQSTLWQFSARENIGLCTWYTQNWVCFSNICLYMPIHRDINSRTRNHAGYCSRTWSICKGCGKKIQICTRWWFDHNILEATIPNTVDQRCEAMHDWTSGRTPGDILEATRSSISPPKWPPNQTCPKLRHGQELVLGERLACVFDKWCKTRNGMCIEEPALNTF